MRNGTQRYSSHCKECEKKRAKIKDAKRRDAIKQYYQDNKEWINKKQREWHHANKSSVRERKTKHSRTDLGRESNYRRNMKRRSKKYGVQYENHTFLDVLDKYNWTCAKCSKWVHDVRKPLKEMSEEEISHKAVADHIIPLKSGGDTVSDNIQILCFSCNSAKVHEDFGGNPKHIFKKANI